jgi:hypothetical protein
MPWGEALELSDADALGMVVGCGELEGAIFDWDAMKWRERTV